MERNVIICDLDGTLADLTHRRHFVEHPPVLHGSMHSREVAERWRPDWKAFHEACVDDTPLETTIQVVQDLVDPAGRDRFLWIVSGRSESVRAETETWLMRHSIKYDYLVMRPVGNYTPDDELKLTWLRGGKIPPKERILCVFDDRDRVVKMWRAEGLTCYQVAPGNF